MKVLSPTPFAAPAIPTSSPLRYQTMAARCGWLIASLPCLLLTGCGGSDDSIKTYRVAVPTDKDRGKGDDKNPGDAGPPKVRFLGAIIPCGSDESYFVRFAEPLAIEKIDPNEKDFDTFLASVRVPGEGGKPVSWTVPLGWKEGPVRQTRMVTLQKDGSPDMYISTPFGGSVLMNVNRWRTDFVGLKKVTEGELKDIVKEIKVGEAKGYRVDFRGSGGKGGGMGGPFMGGGS
jgi:hypothetical protein